MLILLLLSCALFIPIFPATCNKDGEVNIWALLVGGTSDPIPDEHQAFRDVYYMYHVLVYDLGVSTDNIKVLYPWLNSPYDIPEDHFVDDYANKTSVSHYINDWLANESGADEDDIILVYIFTHGRGAYADGSWPFDWKYDCYRQSRIDGCPGDQDPYDEGGEHWNATSQSYFGVDEGLWFELDNPTRLNPETLYFDDEFKQDLNALPNCTQIVLLQSCIAENETSCFSGGFIDDLSAKNRIIITSANETWSSCGDMDQDGFSEFSEGFTDAIHRYDTTWDYSNATNRIKHENPVNADSNSDGHVSIWEAFQYAIEHDESYVWGEESPWYDDDGDRLPTFETGSDCGINIGGSLGKTTYLDWLCGDVKCDDKIDLFDLVEVATYFGQTVTNASRICDLNDDGAIDIFDIVICASRFGETWSQGGGTFGNGFNRGTFGFTSEGTEFSVYQSQITVHKHETFSVDVTITNVTDMYGWEFKLYWNNALLNCTGAQIHVLGIWSENMFTAGEGIENGYNATHGRYWKALTALNPATSFNGSTTIVTLTFRALATGTSPLTLQDTKISDSEANAISHTTADGSVTVAPRERFMRGDTHTVNGLTAYKLGTMQSSTSQSVSQTRTEEYGLPAYWGIQIWKRSIGGTETSLTSSIVAQVSRTSQGQGSQSASWNCSLTTLNATDIIVIRVYQKIGSYSWQLTATFTTEQLGATQLDNSTWQIYYYTKLTWTYIPKQDIMRTTATFYWGTTTYNSHILNFEYM